MKRRRSAALRQPGGSQGLAAIQVLAQPDDLGIVNLEDMEHRLCDREAATAPAAVHGHRSHDQLAAVDDLVHLVAIRLPGIEPALGVSDQSVMAADRIDLLDRPVLGVGGEEPDEVRPDITAGSERLEGGVLSPNDLHVLL